MDEPKILVAIRKRPLSKKEQSKGETDIISVKNQQTVLVSQYKQKVDLTKYIEETVFNFDFAFDQYTNNEQIYQCAVRPLVDSAFQGAKVTCFAYGQTGSGKTFTMNGNLKMGVSGLYTLGATDIFAYLSDPRFRHLQAKLSFFQIYCGKLFDLLNKRSELTLREDNKNNINIIGLEETPVDSLDRFQQLLNYGSVQRVTSQNSANNQSSRSHAILQVTLKEGKKVFGKISFIDLAGNQRGADHTDMKKQTRIDGAEINKSLLSLKECIRALDQGKGHTPFRGSKLTMVLKDSFVGFCRTIMIGNVSPSSASSQNTLNTLRYADRVKELRKPTESLTKQELKARQMMLPRQNNNAIKIDINKDDDAQDIQAKRKEAQRNYGIKQDSPKVNRDMQQREMSSDPYRKNPQTQRSRQQSFGNPTAALSRPLVGGLKQSQQVATLQPPVPVNPMSQGNINRQPKSPAVSNNVGKINLPTTQNKAPISSDRNMFQNNNSYQQPQQNQPLEHIPRINSTQINAHKNLAYDNRMDIESVGMTTSQVINRQNNNFIGSNNNGNSNYQNYSSVNPQNQFFGGNQMTQSSHQPYGNPQYQNNQGRGQFQPQFQPQQQQPQQYGNVMNNNPNTISARITQNQQGDRLNQYRSNYQQPDQRSQSANREQYQAQGLQFNKPVQQYKPLQKVHLPEDFEGMIQFVCTSNDPSLKQMVHKKVHEVLLDQQNDLINSHSQTLRSSLDLLKSQMTLIADLQNNRDAISTREYLSLMQDNIDEKISLLEMLRQKMMQFSYKLERVEEIDEQNENFGPRGEDEQLLDDLH